MCIHSPRSPRLRNLMLSAAAMLTATSMAASVAPSAAQAQGVPQIPMPDAPFQGTLGETPERSSPPAYAPGPKAPAGAPNVLVIMLDDVGFGATAPFGGAIDTPALDELAANGIRYNNFHTTAMCSPTRAALLTGRNPHRVGAGVIGEVANGYPGYNSMIPRAAATFGRVLQGNGYSTAWIGKNHNTPIFDITPIGPFDRWPTGLGFEHFYGFMGPETNPWAPMLYEDNRPVRAGENQPGYHMEADFADHAINWLRSQHAIAPNKPFALYYAPGTAHSPLAAPKEWIEKYKGKFDQGWDKLREETYTRQKAAGIIPQDAALTPRPAEIPAWDSLSADQKRVSARGMEVYAAAISYADNQIARVLRALDESGERDNTMIVYIVGDNGSSAEGGFFGTTNDFYHLNGRDDPFDELLRDIDKLGGPETAMQFAVGWGWAQNTPFPWFKQIAGHLGGIRNGMVISWPGHMTARGEIRNQFSSVIDIAPTLYEAVGISAPKSVDGIEQMPLQGNSLVYSFEHPEAPSPRHSQYFEIFGNRGVWQDGWQAATTPGKLPWQAQGVPAIDYKWELYDLRKDFSQAHDISAENPEKLKQMQDLFMATARENNVLPLDNTLAKRGNPMSRPMPMNGRSDFTFWRSPERYFASAWPDVKNRSWTMSVTVEPDATTPDGMIVTDGGAMSGWGLMVLQSRPVLIYRASGNADEVWRIEGPKLSQGAHKIDIAFQYAGGGRGKGGTFTMMVDGAPAGQVDVPLTVGFLFAEEGAMIGQDSITPLTDDYVLPFAFAGTIGPVSFHVEPPPAPPSAPAQGHNAPQGNPAAGSPAQAGKPATP